MPRENKSQYPILGFLSRRDMSGYDLQKLSKRTASYYWSDCNPQVYNTLKKLEDEGLVSSRIDEESGGRNRRVYSITKKGMDFYKTWLERPVQDVMYRDELMLKVANGQHLSKARLRQHLNDAQHQIELQLDEVKDIQEHINTSHSGRKDKPYLLSVYQYVENSLRIRLEWVKSSLNQFN